MVIDFSVIALIRKKYEKLSPIEYSKTVREFAILANPCKATINKMGQALINII